MCVYVSVCVCDELMIRLTTRGRSGQEGAGLNLNRFWREVFSKGVHLVLEGRQ